MATSRGFELGFLEGRTFAAVAHEPRSNSDLVPGKTG